MSVVIDCSVTLAWLYDDERTDVVERVFEAVAADCAWVPAIWHLEVANGLQQGIRQRRINADFRDGALADLARLAIRTDPETITFAWSRTLELADRFRLTTYDASYLELAQWRGLALASFDLDLRAAGRKLGIALLGM